MKSITFILSLILSITAILLITSCPNPINENILNNVKDEIPPKIRIISPEKGSYCANIVEVVGMVTDKAKGDGTAGKVKSLAYEVTGTNVSGEIEFESDGAFTFQFKTTSLAENFTLNIIAKDWNKNETIKALPLRRLEESGIPSFSAEPENIQVTLSWETVPHTQSYTLYYTTNGALPSEQLGEKIQDVTSPYTIGNLKNGNIHVFQLKTVPESGWTVSLSNYIKTIPLSEQTLTPHVIGQYKKIRIEWEDIPSTNEFEVWRSDEKYGSYYNISGPISTNYYIDDTVGDSTWYYYRIKHKLSENIISTPNGAQTNPFPPNPFLSDSVDNIYALDVTISGDYAYVASGADGLQIVDISNPTESTIDKTLFIPGGACNVAVAGNYAYVAANAFLQILDISVIEDAAIINTVDTPGQAYDVAVAGNYAYVADRDAGLQIVYINPPENASIVKAVDTPGYGYDVAVVGNFAFVADGNEGVQIIDISDPEDATIDKNVDTDFAMSLAVSGQYVYVADQEAGLQIIDLLGE